MKLFAIWMKTLCKLWQAEFELTEVQNECRRLAAENARLKAKEIRHGSAIYSKKGCRA